MKNQLLLAVILLSNAACAFSANGEAANASTKVKSLDNFYGLVINSTANVILETGENSSIRFEGEQRDLEKVNTNIENGNLIISGSNTNPLTIYITIKELNLVEVNGSARIFSSNVINSDLLLLKVNGSGSIRLDVRSLSLGMIVKGSGKIYASGSTGSSFTRIYGEGKVYTPELDSFNSSVEINDGTQAYRSNARASNLNRQPENFNN
ncbi:MAG TPA: DUF2807 domain-containing protein [Bacteroidia bacterium]|nr:DUF2807 domain-containing protein [Bacteroidia bacterium]HNS11843.1 DUF2807 domain-containing protein [Bacteroidia bacterium]